MRILRVANLVLFVEIILVTLSGKASAFSISPDLKCGTYRVQGYLGMNNQSQTILTIQHSTASPYELILLGGDISEKMRYLNTTVAAEIYAYRAVHGNNRPMVLFQKWVAPVAKTTKPVLLVKNEPCGLKGRFKSAVNKPSAKPI